MMYVLVGTAREERAFAHPTDLTPTAPDQDHSDHSQRRAVIRPLNLADHEARLRPRDNARALTDPEQADEEGEDAEDEKCCSHGQNSPEMILRVNYGTKSRSEDEGKDHDPAAHPGRLLKRELDSRKLSANRLALDLGVPSGRITDTLNGRRSITADTAVRLGRYFGNNAQFWLDLQSQYDIAVIEREKGADISRRVRPADAA
jgi:addiction module HigA family antidote